MPKKKKIIVVTGGAGFIGSNLIARLVKSKNNKIISLDNYFSGSKKNHIPGVTYRRGHSKNIAKFIKEKPDIIYHLGEYSRVAASLDEAALVWDLNMAGTFGVLEFWKKHKCKLVYAGSSTKFNGRDLAPYTWSKAVNTELIKNYSKWYGLKYATVYFYNVYGPRERAGQFDGAYGTIIEAIAPGLKPGAIVSDVGSVKQAVVRDLGPHIPEGVHLVPAHPVAGTEHSGPEAGFPELFEDRWCILTPPPGTDQKSVEAVKSFWQAAGSDVEIMDPNHHDLVMAMTSHLPHLIAYTIVGTATDLEKTLRNEVIKFSAGGFRDFTRIAASDPTMWRDVFLNNRDAVLEMLQRFSEDITALQRAIRWGEGDTLYELFSRTREVRRGVIEAKQEKMYD